MHRSRVVLVALSGAMLASAVFARPAALGRYEFEEPHMGTAFRIVLYAVDADEAVRASRAAFARITDLDERLTDYKDDSELMRACRTAVQQPTAVSPDVFRVLDIAQRLAVRTGGAFDVTAGALTRLWRRARRQDALPDEAELAAARAASGYQLMQLDAGTRAIRLERPGVRIDVGGIAKGYAADRGLEALRAHGVSRAMVVAGGEMALGDPPPARCGWRITIAPLSEGGTGSTLELSNAGVSTSGDAEQWMEIGGVRYSHILDARTGHPLTRHLAVTVVAPDATTSDMLATAVAVLGEREGFALADEYGSAALFVTAGNDGREQPSRSRRWTVAGPELGAAACGESSSRKTRS